MLKVYALTGLGTIEHVEDVQVESLDEAKRYMKNWMNDDDRISTQKVPGKKLQELFIVNDYGECIDVMGVFGAFK